MVNAEKKETESGQSCAERKDAEKNAVSENGGLRRRRFRPVRYIALAGVYTALLIGGKEALAAVPNVEVVTLLCALGGYALGPIALVSAAAFVAAEGAIYGFGSWTVSYIIHWPLAVAAFMLLRLAVRPSSRVLIRVLPTAAALLLTAEFSVLTSLADVGLLTGFYDNFAARFAVYFARGIPFYIAQLATNAVVFPLIFPPLAKTLIKLKKRLF